MVKITYAVKESIVRCCRRRVAFPLIDDSRHFSTTSSAILAMCPTQQDLPYFIYHNTSTNAYTKIFHNNNLHAIHQKQYKRTKIVVSRCNGNGLIFCSIVLVSSRSIAPATMLIGNIAFYAHVRSWRCTWLAKTTVVKGAIRGGRWRLRWPSLKEQLKHPLTMDGISARIFLCFSFFFFFFLTIERESRDKDEEVSRV